LVRSDVFPTTIPSSITIYLFEFDENAYAFATAGLSSAPAHPHEDFRVKESQSFDRKSEMK